MVLFLFSGLNAVFGFALFLVSYGVCGLLKPATKDTQAHKTNSEPSTRAKKSRVKFKRVFNLTPGAIQNWVSRMFFAYSFGNYEFVHFWLAVGR